MYSCPLSILERVGFVCIVCYTSAEDKRLEDEWQNENKKYEVDPRSGFGTTNLPNNSDLMFQSLII